MYGSQFDAGPATGMPAIGVPLPNADPTQDYIATGPGRLTPSIPQLLPSEFDDVSRQFGHRTYEAMLVDPAVNSTYKTIKLSTISGPAKVAPAVKPKGFRGNISATLKASDQPTGTDRQATKLSDDERQSLEVAEFVEWEQKSLKTPIKTTILQKLDAMAFGNKLAEKTRKYVETGQFAGKLALKSIKVKPYWSWRFVVNAFMDVTGILTYVPPMSSGGPIPDGSKAAAQGGFLILPREKFTLFAWMPVDNDPRGTSVLRAAYDWWNLKRQMMPQHYRHAMRFGSPIYDGTLAQMDTAPRRPIDPRTGLEIPPGPGQPANVSAADRFTQNLALLQNNSIIVHPFGSEVKLIESAHNGEVFDKGFRLYDEQICMGIALQVRTQMESKHGSKADAESSKDTGDLIPEYAREWLADLWSREVYYDSVKLNYGEEIADKFTPTLIVGGNQSRNKGELWKAAASLGFKIGDSQAAEMDVELDLPERDLEADRAYAELQAQQEAAAAGPQAEPKPKGVPAKSGGDGKSK